MLRLKKIDRDLIQLLGPRILVLAESEPFTNDGGKLITCMPEEHDRMMIAIQAIRHEKVIMSLMLSTHY